MAVTALGFVHNQEKALREMVRVTRRRFVLGLLNRHSLLYLQKGLRVGTGEYQGTRWYTSRGIRGLLSRLPVDNLNLQTSVLVPSAGAYARMIERCWPKWLLCGGFLAVAGRIRLDCPER
ncbi:MAG: hypothetical protein RBG13Loki_2048 [Promethearchaeota archaeon CR_4]|nr:MAG: hypothetical protein RBG13Loki_2048 [Candidatus Lokiarchaeota archaeon CR_4]